MSSRRRREDDGGDTVKIWNHIQAVTRGKKDHLRTSRILHLPENGEAQPPHFVANRSLKALITESSRASARPPSAYPAAACRSVTDS